MKLTLLALSYFQKTAELRHLTKVCRGTSYFTAVPLPHDQSARDRAGRAAFLQKRAQYRPHALW